MASFLGIKYHSKLSDNEYLTGKKTLSGAWDDLNGGVSNVVGGVSDTVSDSWNTVKSAGESVYNAGVSTVDSVTKGFRDVASTLKKYWYVPVVVGGVIIGFKLIGTANTTKILKSLAN